MIDKKFLDLIKPLVIQVVSFSAPVDKLLATFFYNNRSLNKNKRMVVYDTVYAIIRNFYKLSEVIDPKDIDKLIKLAWLKFTNIPSTELVNLDLDKLKDLANQLDQIDSIELPQWMLDKLKAQYPNDYLDLVNALLTKATVDIRINPLKTTKDKVFTQLQQERFNLEQMQYSPYGIRLTGKVSLVKHPLLVDGEIEIQDESSQLAVLLFAPKRGEMVVDFCAGSGGKALFIGALMHNSGRIYASDVHDKRLSRLKPRLSRSGLSNVYPLLIENENDIRIKRLYGKIDRVFVDSPCSGLGTLRRNPELKFRQSEETIHELNIKQKSILNSASKLVKPGGHLLYATCSILREENQDIIEDFLKNNPQFEIVNASQQLTRYGYQSEDQYLQLLPHRHQSDGFFACILRHKNF